MPMAGRGSRYAQSEFTDPKPLISVAGKPMFEWALKSIGEIEVSKLIVVSLVEHELKYGLRERLNNLWTGSFELILLENVTAGQLCTVLAASHLLDTDEDVLIISSDTLVISNLEKDIRDKSDKVAGIISVMNMPGDNWSFAKTNENGDVIEVAEKIRISDHASTGIYYFAKGSTLLHYGEQLVRQDRRTKGEFYIMPLYQDLIASGHRIQLSTASEMWDMGTPDAKSIFEEHVKMIKT